MLLIVRVIFGLLLSLTLMAPPERGQAGEKATPLVLERTIALPNVSGRIDHLAIDLGRKRLMVAELGNGTLDIIDLVAGKSIHRIEGLHEPQGVGYVPKEDLIAVASAGDGSVRLFHAEDFSPLAAIDLGDDADNIRLDPRSGRLIAGYGGGALAVLDPVGRSVVSRAKLPAHPEGFQLDPATRRVFVNLPDAQEIAVVDIETGKQIAAWHVPELRANFPLARESTGAALASVFRTPARLVLLDQQSGEVRATMRTCGDADDVFFDERRKRIYVSCGEGSIDVFERDESGYRSIGLTRTAAGARTSLFVPEHDRLFVAARAGSSGSGADAAILIFRPQP
jgi:hypothetical protein